MFSAALGTSSIPVGMTYMLRASAISSSLLFKKWPYLIASSTVASLTSTFLGQNLLKAFAYSTFSEKGDQLQKSDIIFFV